MLRKTHRGRLPFLAALPVVAFLALGARLYHVQVVQHRHFRERAAEQQRTEIPIRPKRGEIVTSDGVKLAVSTPAYAVYAETRLIDGDHRALARRLAMLLGGSAFDLEQRLKSGRVITLARKVDTRIMERIELLRQEYKLSRFALRFEEEGRRHHPHGSHAAHVVGYVGLDEFGDNMGLDGLELQYDAILRGSVEKFNVARDAVQKRLEPVSEDVWTAAFGDTLTLTLNSAIQYSAETALNTRCEELSAHGGAVIVSEVKTGRVLAMASYPTFDVNAFSSAAPESRRNRCTTHAVEPGSVAKIFTMALLINERLITPYTEIDCEGGRARMGRRLIKDSPGHYLHVAPIREIFMYSSNVGTNKAAALMEGPRFYAGLSNLGMGRPTNVGMPGEIGGYLPPLAKWSGFTMSSLPMGYEFRTTPCQVAQAVGAIANHGVMMQLYLVEEVHGPEGRLKFRQEPTRLRRVVDPYTSQQMLGLMEAVVVEGTGKKAAIGNYRVGGKTGTAHKYDTVAGGYPPGKYYSSFAGVIPADDPELLIYVLIDEPRGMKWGGDVAAPIFQAVARDALRIHGLSPEARAAEAGPGGDGVTAVLADVQSRRVDERMAPTIAARTDEMAFEPTTVETTVEAMEPTREEERERRRRRLSGVPEYAAAPMPDLLGMTMAEARETLPAALMSRCEFVGSGVVVAQQPAAGTVLDSPTPIAVQFSPAGGGLVPR